MAEFQGKMRLSANPFDLVGADIEVSEGNLALIVSDHEIGEWPLDEVAIDAAVDGFHMRVDGEEFVFTTSEADAFAAAVGIARFGTHHKKPARSVRAARHSKAPVAPKPPRPEVKVPSRDPVSRQSSIRAPSPRTARSSRRRFQRMRSLLGKVDVSGPQGKIGLAVGTVVVVLAFVARPVLAGMLLFVGMAAVLLIGAAVVDPLLATRLPEGWPPSRLVVVALTVIVSGLLLVAF